MIDEFDDEGEDDRPVRLVMVMSGEAFARQVSYPVVVEMMDKVKSPGSRRRKYLAAFNEKERKTISKWYNKFYKWYLVTGTPRRVGVKPSTLRFLQRVVGFFATV